MARKKEPEKAPNHERWLVSYADFITLLFAVFVTLYAMSQTDKKKVEEVAASYRSAFGITAGMTAGKPQVLPNTNALPIPSMKAQPKAPEQSKGKGAGSVGNSAGAKEFKAMLITLEKHLVASKAQDKITLDISTRGLVISLKEAGFFDSGSAVVKPAAFDILAKIGEMLRPYDNEISFEGHTDNMPIHSATFQSNWELSTARATCLARHFMDRLGMHPDNISITGYGEYRPVAENTTEAGRRQNRRVDLVVLAAAPDQVEELHPAQPPSPLPKVPF